MFFTTNLVKKMTREEIDRMVRLHVRYINISLETLNKEKYEYITRVRNTHFFENIEEINKAVEKYKNAPKIRFITMLLKQNKDEIVEMTKRTSRFAGFEQHEFRTPYITISNTPLINQNLEYSMLSREEIKELEQEIKEVKDTNAVVYAETNLGFSQK